MTNLLVSFFCIISCMNKLNKCNFCPYFVGKSCAYGLDRNKNHYQCQKAINELYKYIIEQKKKNQNKRYK